MFRAFAESRNVGYLRLGTRGFCVFLTSILVAYFLPITLPSSDTRELAKSSAGGSQPVLRANAMTSEGLVEGQAGKQTAVKATFESAREIYNDPLGPGSKQAAQLTSLEAQSFNIPASAPTPDVKAQSSDGSMELALPDGWRSIKPEGASAKIVATNGKGSRVIVRVYPKGDFKDARAFANFAVNKLKLFDNEGVNKIDIQIGGKPAVA